MPLLENIPNFGTIKTAVVAILNRLLASLTLEETGATLTATGGEDEVYGSLVPLGNTKPKVCFIKLDAMLGGDTTIIREYYNIGDGVLELLDVNTYVGVDGGLPNNQTVIYIDLKPNRYGFEITLEQTAGAMRDYVWSFMQEV